MRAVTGAALLLSAVGCSLYFSPAQPPGLRTGEQKTETAPGSCPPIAGLYRKSSSELLVVLEAMLPYEQRQKTWSEVVIEGHPDTSVTLVLREFEIDADTVTLRRDRDYDCDSGWLHPRLFDDLFRSEKFNDNRTRRHDFFIASDDQKQLVGRHDILSFVQFDVWCGDGCKGFPIPWTLAREARWSFLSERGDPGASPEERAVNDRLAAEEAALEYGPPGPPIEQWIMRVVRKRLGRFTIEGMGPQLTGINVSVILPDSLAIPIVVDHLRSAHGVLDARHESLYRTFDPEGRVHIVIHVEPDTAVFDALRNTR